MIMEMNDMKTNRSYPTQEEIIAYNRAESYNDRKYRNSMISFTIGCVGMILTVIVMLIVGCQTAQAQTMFEVQYESQADIRLYEVGYPSQADMLYYEVEYRSQVNEKKNHWYWVKYTSQAKYRVWWAKYPSQADRKVYKVKYPSQTR